MTSPVPLHLTEEETSAQGGTETFLETHGSNLGAETQVESPPLEKGLSQAHRCPRKGQRTRLLVCRVRVGSQNRDHHGARWNLRQARLRGKRPGNHSHRSVN
jgi:hypothetical protein